MSVQPPKRADGPDTRHTSAYGNGPFPVLKAVLVLSVLPVGLFASVVLSIRAELAADDAAKRTPAGETRVPPDRPTNDFHGGFRAMSHHLCPH